MLALLLLLGAVQDPLLDKLVGTWEVTGTIHGKPVHQRVEGTWILAHRFMRLHFTTPSGEISGAGVPYEAEVLIGWDEKNKRYTAHWIDVFGGGNDEPVAHGRPNGPDSFIVEFNYPDNLFRDTFRWSAKTGWSLLIESQDKAGKWSTFADERFSKKNPQ